jgi:hypothetical protein
MLVTFENLIEGNINSPNFGKVIAVEVDDTDIEKMNAIRKRAADLATRILNA